MNKLVWVFPQRMMKNGKFFSSQWLISQKNIHVPLAKITGASVWLVQSRQDGSFLFGYLRIINIAKNLNQIHKDSLTLFTDRRVSFQILPKNRTVSRWSVENINNKAGIRFATKAELRSFVELIGKNKEISLKKHMGMPANFLQSIKEESVFNFSRMAYSKVLETNSLGDLKYPRDGKSPFGEILSQTVSNELPDSSLYNNDITRLDRNVIEILEGVDISKRTNRTLHDRLREVDTDLTKITPDEVGCRLFLSSSFDLPKSQKTLKKLQSAEKRHQNIIREVATAFLSLNLIPLQSSSIDLSVKIPKGLFLFEVKSTTSKNFETQVKKSFIQILEYKMAFQSNGYKDVFSVVIIEDIVGNYPMKNYLADFASYLDVNLIWFRKNAILSDVQTILGLK